MVLVTGTTADGLFLVHSLRKFINVVGVGFATSSHRPNTGGPEIAVTIRGGNAVGVQSVTDVRGCCWKLRKRSDSQ